MLGNRPVTRGAAGRRIPPKKHFSPSMEKSVGYSLILLEIVQKFRLFSENSSPLLVSQAGYGRARNLNPQVTGNCDLATFTDYANFSAIITDVENKKLL